MNSTRGLPQKLAPTLVPDVDTYGMFKFMPYGEGIFPNTCNDCTTDASLAVMRVEPLPIFENSLRDCTSTRQSKTDPR